MTDPQPNNPITNPTESVYLSRTGIGTVKPAAGHDEDCYGNDCEECEVHAEKCVCPYCVAYRVEHPAPAEPDPYEHLREAMPHPNQLDLAQSFIRMYKGHFAYDRAGIWRQWDWDRWEPETRLTFEIGQHVKAMLGWAEAKAEAKKAWLNLPTFRAVAELAQHSLAAEWDTGPLVGMPDGCALDTTTGRIVVNGWQHYISRYLPDAISTASTAPSERWITFVMESLSHYATADRQAIHDYLQQYVGSALTGDCRDEAMVFLYGPPGTGKSTFAETLLQCFGEYGATIAGERVAKDHSQHLQWLAGLRGKRLVAITELPQRGKWQTSVMDQLISGEMIEANRMRADSDQFPVPGAHLGNWQSQAVGQGIYGHMEAVAHNPVSEQARQSRQEPQGAAQRRTARHLQLGAGWPSQVDSERAATGNAVRPDCRHRRLQGISGPRTPVCNGAPGANPRWGRYR